MVRIGWELCGTMSVFLCPLGGFGSPIMSQASPAVCPLLTRSEMPRGVCSMLNRFADILSCIRPIIVKDEGGSAVNKRPLIICVSNLVVGSPIIMCYNICFSFIFYYTPHIFCFLLNYKASDGDCLVESFPLHFQKFSSHEPFGTKHTLLKKSQ